ncbi:hypothetical protein Holit_02566 [Hollandina sp. SP2]
MAKKSAQIIEIRKMVGETGLVIIEQVNPGPVREPFNGIEDKRFEPYAEHLLSDIVMITLMAVMAQANEWHEIAQCARLKERWLRGFLVVLQGIPSDDTMQPVLSMIDGGVLYRWCIQFLIRRLDIRGGTARRRREQEGAIAREEEEAKNVAIDGKTSRGSKRNKRDREAVKGMHWVSA